MASDKLNRIATPIVWLLIVAVSAGMSGWCYANGMTTWFVLSLAVTMQGDHQHPEECH